MRLSLTLLGTDLFSITFNRTETQAVEHAEHGDSTSYPVGFVRNEAGAEWEQGVHRG